MFLLYAVRENVKIFFLVYAVRENVSVQVIFNIFQTKFRYAWFIASQAYKWVHFGKFIDVFMSWLF